MITELEFLKSRNLLIAVSGLSKSGNFLEHEEMVSKIIDLFLARRGSANGGAERI